jgi:hypothetical protein
LAAAHSEYGATRWATLSEEDRERCAGHEAFAAALRDSGVGGMRFATQVKCLHVHLAHALAGGRNPIGARVLAALDRGDDAALVGQLPAPPAAAAEIEGQPLGTAQAAAVDDGESSQVAPRDPN